jgi:hypothetical protein
VKRAGSAAGRGHERSNQRPPKHEDRFRKSNVQMETLALREDSRCNPNQSRAVQPIVSANSPSIHEHAQRLRKLFEYLSHKFRESLRDKAPACEESFKESRSPAPIAF